MAANAADESETPNSYSFIVAAAALLLTRSDGSISLQDRCSNSRHHNCQLSSPGPGIRIISRIGTSMKHARFRIDDDHGHFAHRPRTTHSQLMPFGDQCLLHFLADARLDAEVTRIHRVREGRGRETARRPTWRFDRLLDVHAEVHHVQKRLNCAHELIVSSGTSHQSVRLAILHDERG